MVLFRSITACWLIVTTTTFGNLDAPIDQCLNAKGIAVPEIADDATFLRRAYLDAVGRIPTVEEARTFLDSTSPDKRNQLIDELLNSEGYAKHWFHFWADLLRVNTAAEITRSGIVGSAYSEWILESLRKNVPYDQFVRDLVGGQGNIWEPENAGAVGFYERDFGMPLDHFSNLMRVFAGTRMECAQCHAHPFDHWSQMDFYQMAAFTWNVRAGKYPEIYEQITGPQRSAINTITIPMRFGSVLPRRYPLKLPHDYYYDDAEPFDVVDAATAFGEIIEASDGEPKAKIFADWLTSAENPRFKRVVVNRLWNELFGAPLIPRPLDDLRDDTQAWNPELESAAIELIIDLDFDIRAFIATVMKSKAYQGRAQFIEQDPKVPANFSSPYLRRMSAEQVWDSLVALITDEPDRPALQRKIYRTRYLADLQNRARKIDGNPDSVRAWLTTAEGRRFVAARGREEIPAVEAEIQALQIRQKKYFSNLDRLKRAVDGTPEEFADWKKKQYQLYRACELDSPAPLGHFLREFGQSDRLEISNASAHATVPQSLALLNGEWTETVLNPYSKFSRSVSNARSSGAKLDTIFLGLLARYPNEAERQELEALTSSPGGPRLLASAILLTAEFLFVK